MVSSRVGAEGGIALARGLAAGAPVWGGGPWAGLGLGLGLPAPSCSRRPHRLTRLPALSPPSVPTPQPHAATGLVRLDIHDNPITADFAADLAAVLAKQAKLKVRAWVAGWLAGAGAGLGSWRVAG